MDPREPRLANYRSAFSRRLNHRIYGLFNSCCLARFAPLQLQLPMRQAARTRLKPVI